ncbi:sensory box histidine kinase/response regulator [Legionella nautarum]|uniref:histidine kinase n=1 Tax=Legionella nautarum TaxID=45070 RepID=A0A0W0WLQ5_9GAMM|nr:ATP-binding protein [Legionella nautarum]KTD33266.1 sensory box histidine kinase/response regulator [Legionella nautarum]
MDYKTLLSLCLNHSDNLILILSSQLHIEEINPTAIQILGWKKEEVCNKPIDSVFKHYAMKPFIKSTQALKKEQQLSLTHRGFKIDWRITPVYDKESKQNLIFALGKYTKELTAKQVEYLQLKNVVKYAPGLFYWKDKNSVYLGCNEGFANLAGLESSAEVVGKTDFDLIWKDRAQLYVDVDQEVIRTGKARLNHEENIAVSQGQTITAITNKVPMYDNQHNVIGILGITTNITEQKRLLEDLKRAKENAESANQVKTEFIANMSHDIRTPLSGIIGMSRFLEEKASNEEEKQYARWVNESGEQLLKLLNGVLDVVSAAHLSEHDIQAECFNLRQSINDIVQLEKPTIFQKNLKFKVDIDEEIPQFIVCDRFKLNRILLNLVGNAIKFTEHGYIGLSVKQISKQQDIVNLKFSVSDTGPGIPKTLQSKVFERFYRISPSYKGDHQGHGVGLHIAEKYVALMGGEIELESVEGKGTTFYFTISLAIGEEKNANIPIESKTVLSTSESSLEQNTPSQISLLLVEDNDIALRMIELIAEKAGCRYISVTDGEQALALAKSKEFDLIITDIGLPGLSGNELTSRIRDWEKELHKAPIPIVGLTAHGLVEAKNESIQAGMNQVLSKPITLPVLKTVLSQLLPRQFSKNEIKGDTKEQSLNFANTEEEKLFFLNNHPNLDIELGLYNFGNEAVLRDLLTSMHAEEIPHTLTKLEQAYSELNWKKIEALAHKLKSSALYCGTEKLKFACQYLECYHKSGQTQFLEPLYQQLITVLNETEQFIKNWLEGH